MKSAILLFLISTTLLFQGAKSQVLKSEMMLGGNIGFNKSKSNKPYTPEQNSVTTTFNAKFGRGFAGGWVLGVIAGYEYSKADEYDNSWRLESHVKDRLYEFGLFGRKFYAFKEQFGIFGEASINYGFGDLITVVPDFGSISTTKAKQYQYSVSVTPGLYFKPGKKFLIEATIGDISYTYSKSTPDAGLKTTNKEFNASFTNGLTFGLFFLL